MAANGSLLFLVPWVTDPESARVSLKYDRPLDPVREVSDPNGGMNVIWPKYTSG